MPKSRTRKKKPGAAKSGVEWGASGYGEGKRKRDWTIAGIAAAALIGGGVWWMWTQAAEHRAFEDFAVAGAHALDRVERTPNRGRQHVSPGTPMTYPDEFPTSGDHWPVWTQPGVYGELQPTPMLIHAMEHGNVVIYYETPGDAAWDSMTAWADIYAGQWDGLVVTPRPGLGDDVVLSAWTRNLRLDVWDPAAAAAFIDAYRGRGPENPVR